MVSSAEPLISPISFFYADEILDEALKADPKNRQAQFYKAFLAPFMKFRGFLTRIGKGAHVSVQQAGEYFSIYNGAQGGLRDFLNEPAQPMLTEDDFQAFVGELLVEQTKLIDFIKQNNSFLTHFSFPISFKYNEMIQECYAEKLSKGTYKLSPCAYQTHEDLRMNRGDWEAFSQILNGLKIAMVLATAYDMNGYFEYMEKDIKRSFKSQKQVFDFMNKVSSRFGTLRSDHKLRDVLEMASDVYGGLRWLMSIQVLRGVPNGIILSGSLQFGWQN